MKRAHQKITSELFTVDIESMSHEGRGIANINRATTFVTGALIQEQATCRITKKHKNYNEAQAVEILKASPERVTPECAHFNMCGGCSLQHMNYDSQIQLKQKTLLDQLNHFGKVTPEEILPPLSGNPWGYRRKARLGVRYIKNKEKLLVGFREKLSNKLADIQSCPVLHPHVGKNIQNLAELIASLTAYDHVPQIEVAVGDKETALVIRHLIALSAEDVQKLMQFGEKHHFQIYLQPNAPGKLQKIWPQDNNDKLSYSLQSHNLTMQFHPLDFIQVNGEMNQLMLDRAIELLDLQQNDSVLDLFCGLGNFTLPIARKTQHVTGVEGGHEMVIRAQENAAFNSIKNVEFHAANLAEPSDSVTWMKKKYDKILLDPPRTGAKEIIEFFPKLGAKRIVYVSCNPATLARDAGILVYNQGYKLKKVGVINMFPHTSHIEAVAVFEK